MNFWKKYKKNILLIGLELIISYLAILFFAVIFNIGLFNPFSVVMSSGNDVNILTMSGIEMVDGRYCTVNDDPWLLTNYNHSNVLLIDFNFDNGNPKNGRIFYADDPANFSEDCVMSYTFHSGENAIIIDDSYVNYLRLDITDKEDCTFTVNSIEEMSRTAYELSNLKYLLYLALAIAFTILIELIRLTNEKKEKVDRIFWLVLGISLVVIFGRFLIGNAYYIYRDIGTDTYYQYYPYFVNEVLSIRDGSFSVWNWNYGLGTSIMNMMSWTLDPFAVLIVLFGVIFGANTVHYLLVWMQIIKIITVFILCKKFLGFFLEERFSICLGAYLCTLNGYIFLWGQHFFLGTACVYVLFILCAI